MSLPRRTRTPAMRLRDELRRMSTEELIAVIKTSVERDYGEYVRSGRADRDRRRRRQLERQEQSQRDEQKEEKE